MEKRNIIISYLIAGLTGFLLITVLGGLIYENARDKNKESAEDAESSSESSSSSLESTGFKFANVAELNEVNEEYNFFSDECSQEFGSLLIQSSSYRFEKDGTTYSNRVLHNAKSYVGQSTVYDENYEVADKLFNEFTETPSIKDPSDSFFTFKVYCVGSSELPAIGKIVDYDGADSSFLIVRYGSKQSVVDSRFFPVYLSIYSKKGNDISTISLDKTFQLQDLLLAETNLDSCTIQDDSGFFYIDIFDPDKKYCIENLISDKFDLAKIDAIAKEAFEIYSLK